MIRTGEEYRSSLDDGREVWINGQRVEDICSHPQLKPVIDVRSRIYDMQHDPDTQKQTTYEENGERFAIGLRLPYEKKDWQDKIGGMTDAEALMIVLAAKHLQQALHKQLLTQDSHLAQTLYK